MIKTNLTKFPGVHRRADSGIYQFGLRAPVDLLTHFPSAWAVRCSLMTADLRQANAKAKELQAEWAGRFESLRSGKAQPVDLISVRRKLYSAWKRVLSKLDDAYATLPKAERDQRAEGLALQVMELRDYLSDGELPEWAEDAARRYGDPSSPAIVTEVGGHLMMLYEVMHEALTDERRTFPLRVRYGREREQALESLEANDSHVSTAQIGGKRAPIDGKKIANALEAWTETKRPTEKTRLVFERHARQFADLMDDPWLSYIDKTAAIAFRDKLQAWAIAEKKTARTADNVLVSIRALFNVACDKGWLASSPMRGLSVEVGGKESELREPWTHEELKKLFDDDIWTKHALPENRKAGGEAAYWIPLIACYTGARLSEIAQLWTDDVSTAHGAEVLEFTADGEREQKLKNAGSWRAVPMHSELVRLGLCEYVASLPEGYLFPLLPKDGKNGAGGQFGQWFGLFKRNKGFTSPTKSFHSFRHLVATELRLAGATDAQADAITGHAGEGIGRRVYSATIRRQAERLRPAVELLRFPIAARPRAS